MEAAQRQGASSSCSPHVLIFPLPIQGPVNAMLKLAQLLAISGLKVTFLNSDYNHARLLRFANIHSRFEKYPDFSFKTIPDGLPHDRPRSGNGFNEMFEAMNSKTKPLLKNMLVDMNPPVDCIIGDGVFGFVLDVANELGIPIINFRTIGASYLWSNYCIPDMIEAGDLPIKGSEDMDRPIAAVAGMESFLRWRDLPSFCRGSNVSESTLLPYANEARKSLTARGVILNTFEELEGPILSQIRTKCPNVYTIGPLNEHFKTRMSLNNEVLAQSHNCFWEVDRSCMSWLDKQPDQSVLYVSFGSMAVMSNEQAMEFWHGLVNSQRRFLWVVRPDSLTGKGFPAAAAEELLEGTKERGCIVGWAPQEEVLGHKAVGGFLTHSGWNSTMESIVAGVPMLCWPYFVDQQLNSRLVGEVWKLGIDMKDVCDRKIIEEMVNDLMVERRDEFVKSATEMARVARACVSVGGHSYSNFDRLIHDIKTISMKNHG